jgi:hypothetical protein
VHLVARREPRGDERERDGDSAVAHCDAVRAPCTGGATLSVTAIAHAEKRKAGKAGRGKRGCACISEGLRM